MPSTPTYKNLDALIEQPDSRQRDAAETVTETRIYMAKYSVCLANQKTFWTAGTGDLAGFVIKQSSVTRSKGDLGRLVEKWELGGPDADPETTPLPPDRVSLNAQDLNPSVEKCYTFRHAIADLTPYTLVGGAAYASGLGYTLIDYVRQAGLLADDDASKKAWDTLIAFVATEGPLETKFSEALLLADLLRRGVQNFYKCVFDYTWTTYHFSEPSVSAGGYLEVPGGPLASIISGLGLVCLRKADNLNFDGALFELTNTWTCALSTGDTFWEPILYVTPFAP